MSVSESKEYAYDGKGVYCAVGTWKPSTRRKDSWPDDRKRHFSIQRKNEAGSTVPDFVTSSTFSMVLDCLIIQVMGRASFLMVAVRLPQFGLSFMLAYATFDPARSSKHKTAAQDSMLPGDQRQMLFDNPTTPSFLADRKRIGLGTGRHLDRPVHYVCDQNQQDL